MTIPARLNIITLGVSDLGRSSAFYEALGWELSAMSSEHIRFFDTAGGILSLYPYEDLANDARVPVEPRSGFCGITLAINVETPAAVEEALQTAVDAGATLLKPAMKADWGGVSGYFADPDGHPWEVAHNPFVHLREDGSVMLPHAPS